MLDVKSRVMSPNHINAVVVNDDMTGRCMGWVVDDESGRHVGSRIAITAHPHCMLESDVTRRVVLRALCLSRVGEQ